MIMPIGVSNSSQPGGKYMSLLYLINCLCFPFGEGHVPGDQQPSAVRPSSSALLLALRHQQASKPPPRKEARVILHCTYKCVQAADGTWKSGSFYKRHDSRCAPEFPEPLEAFCKVICVLAPLQSSELDSK